MKYRVLKPENITAGDMRQASYQLSQEDVRELLIAEAEQERQHRMDEIKQMIEQNLYEVTGAQIAESMLPSSAAHIYPAFSACPKLEDEQRSFRRFALAFGLLLFLVFWLVCAWLSPSYF